MSEELTEKISKEIDFLIKKIRASINIRLSELKDQIIELQHAIDKQVKSLGIGPFSDAIKHAYVSAVEDWYESFLDSIKEAIEEAIKSRLTRVKDILQEISTEIENKYKSEISDLQVKLSEKESLLAEKDNTIAELTSKINNLQEKLSSTVTEANHETDMPSEENE